MKKRKKLRGKSLLALMLMAALVLQPLSVGAEEIGAPEETALAETVTEDVNVTEDVTEDVAAVPDAEAEEPVLSETVTGDEAGQKDFKSYDNGGSIVVLIDDKCEYKGSEVRPDIEVWDTNEGDDEKELKEGTDYSVTLANNDKPGTATATLTGMGDYKPQSIKQTFLIYKSVAEEDLTVVPSGTYFTVSNNRDDIPLNVMFVSETDDTAITGETRDEYVYETVAIPAGKSKEVSFSVKLTDVENSSFGRTPITQNTQYILKASADEYFQYSKPDLEVKKEAEHTTGEEPVADYKNAYDAAGMTAAVQKNGTVKLTWKPKVKEEKFFAIFQRDAADSEWKKVWPDEVGTVADPGTLDSKKTWSESYNAFSANQQNPKNLEVYLLVCGTAKNGGNVIGKYIAPVAPYLFYAENDMNPQNEEMCFSYMPGTDNLKYRLQVAGANKEKSDKVPEGYQDAWSTDCVSDELYPIGDWNLSKTVTLEATRTTYLNAQPVKTTGKTYYNRVKMVYTFGGKDFTSAPSNVISRKSGPGKTYTFSIVGLKHDAKDANTNKRYAQEYVDLFKFPTSLENVSSASGESDILSASSEGVGEVYAEEGEVTSGEDIDDAKAVELREISADSLALGDADEQTPDIFAHKANTSTETKNGYVFFYVRKDYSSDDLKGFELLKSTTEYGTYSKAKSYNFPTSTSKDVWKLEVLEDNLLYWEGYDIYCVWYNNFPPEQTMYYAVRAVAKSGSATGGFSDGVENTGSLDAVQNLGASVDNAVSITTTWDHDDCAKQYFVYRSRLGFDPFSPDEEFRPDGWDFNEKNYVQIATVSGGSKKTDKATGRIYNTYVDKGNYKDKTLEFEEEKYYAYVVKPVYDTKKAKEFSYNLSLASDPWPGMLSIADADVKNFSAANYCAGTIMLKWKDDKKMDLFQIQRAEGGAYSDPKSIPDTAWTKVGTMQSKKGTSMLEFADSKATIGVNYYYRIAGGKEHSGAEPTWSKWTYFKSKVKSVPLPVVGAKAVANGTNKGARVTWTVNAKDKEAYSSGECTVLIKWSDSNGSSVGYRKATTTGYTDNSYLAPGVKRTYTITIDYKGQYYSSVNVSYTISQGTIALYLENGTPFSASSLDLTNGSWAPLLGNVVSGGQVQSGIPVAATSSNSGIVEVSAAPSGNFTKFSIHCKSVGQAVITFSAQGAPSRSVIINVK